MSKTALPFGALFGMAEDTPTPKAILHSIMSLPYAFYASGPYYAGSNLECPAAIPASGDVLDVYKELLKQSGRDYDWAERGLESSQPCQNFLTYACAALFKVKRLNGLGLGVSDETMEEFEKRVLKEIVMALENPTSELEPHQTKIIWTEEHITTAAFAENHIALRIAVRKNAGYLRDVTMEREKLVDGFLDVEYKQKQYSHIAQDLVDSFIDLRVPLRVWAKYSTFEHSKHIDSDRRRFERPMALHRIYVATLANLRLKMENPGLNLSTLAPRRTCLDDRSAIGYGLGV